MTNVSLWGHAQFRRLFVSTTSFTLGTQIYQLGMPLILYELTRSAAAMTAMRAVELLPNLFLDMLLSAWLLRDLRLEKRVQKPRRLLGRLARWLEGAGKQPPAVAHGLARRADQWQPRRGRRDLFVPRTGRIATGSG